MYSRDSSIPLLTVFVAPVGMTTAHHVTPSGALAESRGLIPIWLVPKKRIFGQDEQDETGLCFKDFAVFSSPHIH